MCYGRKVDRLVREDGSEKYLDYKKSLFATFFALMITLTVVFIVLYSRCYNTYNQISNTKESYIKSYGICESCHQDGYCSNIYDDEYQCFCRPGFVGDGVLNCDDITFAHDFQVDTTNCPRLTISIPGVKMLSFCLWMQPVLQNVSTIPLFSYSAIRENIVVSINDSMNQLIIQINHRRLILQIKPFPILYWTHMCVKWDLHGLIELFINGHPFKEKRFKDDFNGHIHNSTGVFDLGHFERESESQNTFPGKISQFYLYDKLLSSTEISRLYKNNPPVKDLLVSWKSFRKEGIIKTQFYIL